LFFFFACPNTERETREWDREIEREIRESWEQRDATERETRDWDWDPESWGRWSPILWWVTPTRPENAGDAISGEPVNHRWSGRENP
jgi:hypothetical protein